MSRHRAPRMALMILALAILLTGCGETRPIAFRPLVDPRLKEKCPRPVSLPPRGKATYLDLMIFAINADITMDCSDRKIDDLARSIEGP